MSIQMKLPVYNGDKPYIFVSYAHADSSVVLPIINDMQSRGFRIWFDQGIEAGTEWPQYIAEHMNACSKVIVFMSKHTVDSKNCRREINFAIELGKEPLVVYIEEVDLMLGLKLQLNTSQAIFMYRSPNYQQFVEELCTAKLLQDCTDKPQVTQTAYEPAQQPVNNPVRPQGQNPMRQPVGQSAQRPVQQPVQRSPYPQRPPAGGSVPPVGSAVQQPFQQPVGQSAQPTYFVRPVTPVAPQRKSGGKGKKIALICAAVFVVLMIIGILSDTESDIPLDTVSQSNSSVGSVAVTARDTKSFAMENDYGAQLGLHYVYSDDKIYEVTFSIAVEIPEGTEASVINEEKANLDELGEAYEQYDFFTYNYDHTGSTMRAEYRFEDLDIKTNFNILLNEELFALSDDSTYVSLSATEELLTSEGWIEE